MDKIFIQDIDALREFIRLERRKEEYFDRVMDRIMVRKARVRS